MVHLWQQTAKQLSFCFIKFIFHNNIFYFIKSLKFFLFLNNFLQKLKHFQKCNWFSCFNWLKLLLNRHYWRVSLLFFFILRNQQNSTLTFIKLILLFLLIYRAIIAFAIHFLLFVLSFFFLFLISSDDVHINFSLLIYLVVI